MIRKIFLLVAAIAAIWYGYVWCGYHFFYQNPTMEEIQKDFAKDKLAPPKLDSVQIRGYSIKYLTNNLNDEVTPDDLGYRRPYLILLHDSGKNATNYLNYFKDAELGRKFHIIAVDRPGFGKTTFLKPEPGVEIDENYRDRKEFGNNLDAVSRYLVHDILEEEGHHLEEVRIVSEGNAALAGLLGYENEYLGFSKLIMVNGGFSDRFFISKWFSNWVSALPFLFPRAYANKQKDLVFMDKFKSEKEFPSEIDFGVYAKDSEDEGEGYIYRSEKTEFQSVFFYGISKGDEERIKKTVPEKYYVYENEGFNVYKNPKKLFEKLKEGNQYTMSIHWLQ